MRINKKTAMKIWEECFGNSQYANDFHGNFMCKDGYGNRDFYIYYYGKKVYCGWNIHHILPVSKGGTNRKDNLICTNIATNDEAEDKTTYWIDDCLYQVQKIGTNIHEIVRLR